MKHTLFLLVLLLTGCSLAPSYVRPVQELPPSWPQTAGESLASDWWQRFDDPVLDQLVGEALEHNRDLAAATARVLQARARAGRARGDLAPSPALAGNAEESWTSRRIAGGPPKGHESSSLHNIMFNTAWELDFWGKFRNSADSADALLLATESDLAAARLLVAASTAKAYFSLIGYGFQVRIAEQTLTQRIEALEFYQINEAVGFFSRADLLRAESEVEGARYSLAMARLGLEETQSALLVLLGRSPEKILNASIRPGASLETFPAAPVLPDDLPSSLLLRRPDLHAAEQRLRAAHFDVGVVRADYFPSISLTGKAGLAGAQPTDMTMSGALTWGYGLSLNLPLDFWNTRFRELMARAACQEAAAGYEQAVLSAFSDIRSILARQSLLAQAEIALSRNIAGLQEAAIKAEDRHRHGYSNYLDVLDAGRALFDAQLSWAQTRTGQLQAAVDMCMALGGGWEETTGRIQPPDTSSQKVNP